MKKTFNFYIIAWIAALAIFNIIAFIVPPLPGTEKFTEASFWIGYALITVMMLGQAVCAHLAFKANTAKKMFYNISLIKTSYSGLIASFIIGGLCMIITVIPYWIAVIACLLVLVFNIISIIKATVAIEEIVRVDEKIKAQTFFIKALTVDADTLMAQAPTDEIKAECRKVYEAVRYSDPMSHDALSPMESQITLKFSDFSTAVKASNLEAVASLSKELLILVEDRNKKCRLLK